MYDAVRIGNVWKLAVPVKNEFIYARTYVSIGHGAEIE